MHCFIESKEVIFKKLCIFNRNITFLSIRRKCLLYIIYMYHKIRTLYNYRDYYGHFAIFWPYGKTKTSI